MGLFNWLKKEKPQPEKETPSTTAQEDSLLLAMPMFEKGGTYSIEAVLQNLQAEWGIPSRRNGLQRYNGSIDS